jgi:hypothetical protein
LRVTGVTGVTVLGTVTTSRLFLLITVTPDFLAGVTGVTANLICWLDDIPVEPARNFIVELDQVLFGGLFSTSR